MLATPSKRKNDKGREEAALVATENESTEITSIPADRCEITSVLLQEASDCTGYVYLEPVYDACAELGGYVAHVSRVLLGTQSAEISLHETRSLRFREHDLGSASYVRQIQTPGLGWLSGSIDRT